MTRRPAGVIENYARQDRLTRAGADPSARFEQRAQAVRAAGQRWTWGRFFVEWRRAWPSLTWPQRVAWSWRSEVVGIASRDFPEQHARRELAPSSVPPRAFQPSSSTADQPRKASDMARKPNYAVGANGITAREYANAVRDGMRSGGAGKTEARRAAAKAYKSAVRGGARKR